MTAVAVPVLEGRPLAEVARVPGGQLRVRRSVLLAGGGWLATAASRVSAQLQAQAGPTRSSDVLVSTYPPAVVRATLAQTTHADAVELEGARLAAEADAGDGHPRLWLFIASCRVLWAQGQPVDVGFRGLS